MRTTGPPVAPGPNHAVELIRQVEADEMVVAGECFVDETIEHARLPPLVTSSSQGRF